MTNLKRYRIDTNKTCATRLLPDAQTTDKIYKDFQFLKKDFEECKVRSQRVDTSQSTDLRNRAEYYKKEVLAKAENERDNEAIAEYRLMAKWMEEVVSWEESIVFVFKSSV